MICVKVPQISAAFLWFTCGDSLNRENRHDIITVYCLAQLILAPSCPEEAELGFLCVCVCVCIFQVLPSHHKDIAL